MAKFYNIRINFRYTIHAFTYLHVHYNNYDISKHFFDDLEKEIGCIRQNVQFMSKKLFLRIYNIVGKKLHTLQGHSSSMELYSALGNSYFLSKTLMDTEETFRVWDTTSFRCVTSFRHDNYVSMIHYLHLTYRLSMTWYQLHTFSLHDSLNFVGAKFRGLLKLYKFVAT